MNPEEAIQRIKKVEEEAKSKVEEAKKIQKQKISEFEKELKEKEKDEKETILKSMELYYVEESKKIDEEMSVFVNRKEKEINGKIEKARKEINSFVDWLTEYILSLK
jgi:vacuolar-type H+-ATPase subunit H